MRVISSTISRSRQNPSRLLKPFTFSLFKSLGMPSRPVNEYEIDFEGDGVGGEHRRIFGKNAQDAIDKYQEKMGPIKVSRVRRVLFAGDLKTL